MIIKTDKHGAIATIRERSYNHSRLIADVLKAIQNFRFDHFYSDFGVIVKVISHLAQPLKAVGRRYVHFNQSIQNVLCLS